MVKGTLVSSPGLVFPCIMGSAVPDCQGTGIHGDGRWSVDYGVAAVGGLCSLRIPIQTP